MTYLELCKGVRSRIGLQGTGPTTVTAPTNLEADIVDAVRDAWLDIQNSREEWDWMKVTTTFSTVASTDTYTKTDIAGADASRVRRFIIDSLWVNDGTNYSRATYRDEDEFDILYINDTNTGTPGDYTIIRRNGSIKMTLPDDAYTCRIDYWKTPQELSLDADEPEFDDHWHNLIMYLAIQKLSSSIASKSTQFEYAQAYAKMWGELCRVHLKKKSIKVGGIA
jgi:hypothetical protein